MPERRYFDPTRSIRAGGAGVLPPREHSPYRTAPPAPPRSVGDVAVIHLRNRNQSIAIAATWTGACWEVKDSEACPLPIWSFEPGRASVDGRVVRSIELSWSVEAGFALKLVT